VELYLQMIANYVITEVLMTMNKTITAAALAAASFGFSWSAYADVGAMVVGGISASSGATQYGHMNYNGDGSIQSDAHNSAGQATVSGSVWLNGNADGQGTITGSVATGSYALSATGVGVLVSSSSQASSYSTVTSSTSSNSSKGSASATMTDNETYGIASSSAVAK
jgi:hypothetical protein